MTAGRLDIAIAVYRLAAAGGLERHALRLGEALVARGHSVTIYTTAAGTVPDGIAIAPIRWRGMSNHGRLAAFQNDLARTAHGRHDLLVGFQKMAGLDVLFCCDWCFVDRTVSPLARLLPRYRTMAALEEACCAAGSTTKLLMLAEPQAQAYRDAYGMAADRVTVLPPTLDRRRVMEAVSASQRAGARASLGLTEGQTAWLWIGLQPHVKGLDRVIRALALAPNAKLFACGVDTSRRPMRAAMALARKLGCADRVATPGSLSDADLAQHFVACDLLVHPARLDVTGTVIVEALGAGLPVIVTDNCGYALHVSAAGAGVVLPRDASPEQIAAAASVDAATRLAWSNAARDYVRKADLTSGIAVAADIIEEAASQRAGTRRRPA